MFEWRNTVTTLHHKYHWLLFVSIRKLLKIYSIISEFGSGADSTQEDVSDILVRELIFLTSNDRQSRAELKEKIQV